MEQAGDCDSCEDDDIGNDDDDDDGDGDGCGGDDNDDDEDDIATDTTVVDGIDL